MAKPAVRSRQALPCPASNVVRMPNIESKVVEPTNRE